MNILKIKKNLLIKILNIINLVLNKKKIDLMPSNFFLEKKNNKIEFLANNNILELKIILNNKNKNNILIGISIKKLINIIKNFPECILYIKYIKNNKIILKNKDIKFILNTINIINFENIKKKEEYKINFILNKNKLLLIINLINFILKDQNEEELINGILFKIKNNKIKIIATDNYRMIFYQIKIKNTNIKKKIIIPIKTINLLNNILKIKNIKNINIKINKKQILFKIKNIFINSKIIKGNFPRIKEKIFKFYKNNFFLEKNLLKLILKRSISILENKLKFSTWKIRKNLLKIITRNQNEKGEENIIIEYNGKDFDVNINSLHILDIVNNIKFNKIHFNFPENKKIIIIKIPEFKMFKYIIASLKI